MIYKLKPAILLSLLFFLCVKPFAQSSPVYSFEKKIALPGNEGYDYLCIDDINRHLFVTHGTQVQVIDLKTEKLIGSVNHMKGVHGVAVVNKVNKGFISDGKDNAVVVFDLTSFKIIKTIPISGKKPDAIIYDPASEKVFAFCGDSNNACVIDINSLTETGTVSIGGGPEFAVPDGRGLMYNNVEDKNSLVVIDTKKLSILHSYPLAPCGGPTGLALDPQHKRLFTACRENKGMSVVDETTGKVITTVPIGAGVDAVVYDASQKLVFCSNGDGTTTIIQQLSADTYKVVQTLKTQYRAKTMVMDTVTKKIYLSAPSYQDDKKTMIPDGFAVLVYKK